MKRWIAALFLVLTAFYLGAECRDRCEDSASEGVTVCHILCNDGCSTAPIPTPPAPPPPDPMPRPRFSAETPEKLVSLGTEPEKYPPRT